VVRNLFALFALLLMLVTGAAEARSKRMAEAAQQQPTPAAGQALIVFVRSSFVGSAVQATVYEVDGDGQRFLGIVSNKTRVATSVAPGTHRFMVVGESADFLDAQVEAGKTYHVLVSPRMGAWKARFSLLPVRTDAKAEHNVHSDEFAKWISKSTLVEIAPEAEAWYAENRDSVDKKRRKYQPKWESKSDADKAERTLRASDGV
jgi:hypothetical protein